jgi:hypothetical protein
VSASKSVPSSTRKRRPYNQPTLIKLTLEEAKAALDSKAAPGDEQAEQLHKAIKSELEKQDRHTKGKRWVDHARSKRINLAHDPLGPLDGGYGSNFGLNEIPHGPSAAFNESERTFVDNSKADRGSDS